MFNSDCWHSLNLHWVTLSHSLTHSSRMIEYQTRPVIFNGPQNNTVVATIIPLNFSLPDTPYAPSFVITIKLMNNTTVQTCSKCGCNVVICKIGKHQGTLIIALELASAVWSSVNARWVADILDIIRVCYGWKMVIQNVQSLKSFKSLKSLKSFKSFKSFSILIHHQPVT